MNTVGTIEVNFELRPPNDAEKQFCNYKMCKICKGVFCCQQTGCAFSPKDIYVLKNSFSKEERVRYLIHLLKRGYISIEHWPVKGMGAITLDEKVSKEKLLKGDGILYLRARNKGKPIVDIIHHKGENAGPCASWSEEEGCKFPFHRRPKGGQELIPGPFPGLCIPMYPEWVAAEDWSEFQEELYKVYAYFVNKAA